ncbi:MAG: AAA domain-containing protein [Gemmataceae bacterium]
MTSFHDFLGQRIEAGGFATEDALASFLPLLRQAAAAHRDGFVAPLQGINDLHVEAGRIYFEAGKLAQPVLDVGRLRGMERPQTSGVQVVGAARVTTDVDDGVEQVESADIGQRGVPFERPVYLPGYLAWENELGHHDPLSDIFVLGLILGSLTCGLDLTEPEELARFVRGRANLFELDPDLHPVLAKAVVRMTELDRHRRPQDSAALLRTLENYRDQDIDFDFDLARLRELKSADRSSRREMILSRLQQRLFEISRRNRLLHFRQTMQSVNLTWASVPLSFDVGSIRPEQILTWDKQLHDDLAAGKSISLNRQLRFEEAVYLPGLLDEIRNEARRDQAEFGFAHLRLVLCFLRWWNLKEKPHERFDSPLLLLPVKLTRNKGVRDVYVLEALESEAEVNPILRHYFKQLYDIDLPESIELTTTSADDLYQLIAGRVQASEPGVTVEDIARPRIQLIHARARRRLEQYRKRVRVAGRGVRSFLDVDYSYERDNFHPLGLRLFQTRIRPAGTRLSTIVDERPRRRDFMLPATDEPGTERERMLYAVDEGTTNPYHWEFDRCSVTLGNFRYRKMSLVRDYTTLMEAGTEHPGFESIFSLEARALEPARPEPLPIDESYAIVSCDPTQSSAIALARQGRDYIIQGPPGTGKSQTITNLIADYVALGKRVLFVCEKRAAIDVVFHRLRQAGLHSLCCLIHDSQADKKEFVMDLKGTYESYLENQEQASPAESARTTLVEGLQRDLAPVQSFHEAMCGTPAAAGLPLRQLLHRAVELHSFNIELEPGEQERLPLYSHWREHGERIARLSTLMSDFHTSGILAEHPLHLLNARHAHAERPIEAISASLQRINTLLEAVRPGLQALGAHQPQNLADSLLLVRHAGQLRPLAESDRLGVLRTGSELARKLDEFRQTHQDRTRAVDAAREHTRHWTNKLPADETSIALEQARALQSSFLAFLRPSWWRLRGILSRSYDFKAHKLRPTWVQVLDWLRAEHEAEAARAELERQACAHFAFAGSWDAFLQQLADVRAAGDALPVSLRAARQNLIEVEAGAEQVVALARLGPDLEKLDRELADLLAEAQSLPLERLQDELDAVEEALDDVPDFVPCLAELAALPAELGQLLRRWPRGVSHLETAAARRSIDEIFRADRALARFDAKVLARQVGRLEQAHDDWHERNAAVVRERIRQRFLGKVRLGNTPAAQLDAEQKELKSLYGKGRRELEHEFGKTMRYKSIRDLVSGNTGLVVRDLKPVWLMSPLSVADTVPLDDAPFDVVIFDEASQVTLEEAVPAIFRARQVIVVGDEMQLPPTNFFSAKQADDDESFFITDADGEKVEYDLSSNSFLNHAARKLPATMLGWHYRSRSESLISFSNAAFYQGRLLTVPEVALPAESLGELRVENIEAGNDNVARLLDRPVGFHFLSKGIYQQRRNQAEADYIARLVRGLLLQECGLSIGIVAFSEAQQGEIDDALQRLARTDEPFSERLDAELEREEDGQFVGLLVKNLENIQGDERDLVILSVCYGPGPNGKMLMNFGPINQQGGERRLNVAFSRAKKHMVVISSIHHHAITNDYNDGARCLKNYLHYAEAASRGDLASARRVLHESRAREVEENEAARADAVVADLEACLLQKGYRVERDVGQSSFRCDLAVFKEGDAKFRAGILVDTDAYYRRHNLLERDVLRPRLLRAFGWEIVRVLTKDWYTERDEVLRAIEDVLESRVPDPSLESERDGSSPPEDDEEPPQTAGGDVQPAAGESDTAGGPARRYLEYTSGNSRKFWEIVVTGNQHTVRFGRRGSAGQRKTKTFADEAAAARDAERLVRDKLAKGYVQVDADT